MTNLCYVNLHSSTFAGVKYKGQLLKGTTTTTTGEVTRYIVVNKFISLTSCKERKTYFLCNAK
jgi:hypothetical protein